MATRTDISRGQAKALAAAKRWLAEGHEPARVAKALWTRFGYEVEVSGDAIRFDFAQVSR